nr:hypothetical protein [Tanacetum cinerariifolium]
MSFDDLYNNFKIVEQEVKRTVISSSSSGSLNMAFLSSPGSTNEVNTASIQVNAANTPVSNVCSPDNTANLSDATVYAFLENQPNGSQLVHEELEYFQRIGKKITINGSDTAGYDKTKAKESSNSRKTVIVEDTSSKAMVAIDGAGFDWSYMADDEVPTNMTLMAFSDSENSSEFQDTANSGKKKETKAMVFYQMETKEVSDRFVAPCFINGLEAYDGEINLGVEENMISNEYAVKLCLEHEVKRGNKVVKKELIVALRDEEKSDDDWDHLLDFNINDVPMLGTSSSAGGHLTQEAAKEAIAIRMSRKFALLKEERPIIKIMAYQDKYKKILDEVWKDKVELDGKIIKEEEEAVKRIKGEVLKEKEDLGAFIFPIRVEGQVNKNTLADTGSDINTMPYRIYDTLGREDIKKVDRGIMMINPTQPEAMGILTNVLCQVGVTTLIAKFLILEILIDHDSPIVVGQGFLCTMGGIINTPERLFSTFDGFCHQTFCAARYDIMRNAESDSDDKEDY